MEYTAELSLALQSTMGTAGRRDKDISLSAAHIDVDFLKKEVMVIFSRLGGIKEDDIYFFPSHIPIMRLLRTIAETELLPDKDFFDSFSTPRDVALSMWEYVLPPILSDTEARVLEPSAGTGALLRPYFKHKFGKVLAIENHPLRHVYLEHNFYNMPSIEIRRENFLRDTFAEKPFDLIIANPPLSSPDGKSNYINHIWMMLELLKTGGQLVCLVPNELPNGSGKQEESLRRYLLQTGEYHSVPKEAMKEVATKERFSILVAWKLAGRLSRIHMSKHYKEAIDAVRSRASRTVGERVTANQE